MDPVEFEPVSIYDYEGFQPYMGAKEPSDCNCGCAKSIAFGQIITALSQLSADEQVTVLKSVEKYIGNNFTGSSSPVESEDEDEVTGSAIKNRNYRDKTTDLTPKLSFDAAQHSNHDRTRSNELDLALDYLDRFERSLPLKENMLDLTGLEDEKVLELS